MTTNCKARVAFLNTHPIQYFAPLYAYLNASEDLDVSAIYLSDYSIRGSHDAAFGQSVKWDIDLLGGYEAHFVKGFESRSEMRGLFSAIVPGLWHDLRRMKLDLLVVPGHTPAAMLVGVAGAKVAGTAVFMRCDTHLGLKRSRLKSALRRPLLRLFYGSLDGVFAIGSANAEFYRAMRVTEKCIYAMPFVVDNARFIAASRIDLAHRQELRRLLGVHDDRPIVIYAAKLTRGKRPDDLFRAAAVLKREGILFRLVLIGSGEMEQELRVLATELELDNVAFVGFVNQGRIPEHYAASDVFVLPSENETWGLAVNEAMCAGLPIVASKEIGCVQDLVHNGVNGRTFVAKDVTGLANALRPILTEPDLRHRMGNASREIISRWSFAECRDGLRTALQSLGKVTMPTKVPKVVSQS